MLTESIGFYISPIGNIKIVAGMNGLTSVVFTSQSVTENLFTSNEFIIDAIRWLDEYFKGHRPGWVPRLSLSGTKFQISVFRELLNIDYGTLVTYSQIAERAASASGRTGFSARSVGQAVGKNPIAIIIPCHRVCGANGLLTGYAWGLEKKRALIDFESTS